MVQEYQHFVESSKEEEHVNDLRLNTAGVHVNWPRDASSANVTRIIHHRLKCTLNVVGFAQPGVGTGLFRMAIQVEQSPAVER